MATSPIPKRTAKKNERFTHGILILHGAGMPEDQTRIAGDPLSTIADGLIDHFNHDPFLSAHHEMAIQPGVKDRGLEQLDLLIYKKEQDQPRGSIKYRIRMRAPLWKPTTPKQPLASYIQMLWTWAIAFRSHFLRKYEFEKRDELARQSRGDLEWDRDGLKKVFEDDKKFRGQRRVADLRARIVLAIAGLGSILLYRWLAPLSIKLINPQWLADYGPLLSNIYGETISLSLLTAVLLVLLAFQEKRDRDKGGLHSNLQLIAMILCTAWLGLFLTPVLFFLYYIDGVVLLIIASSAFVYLPQVIGDWSIRVVYVLLLAFTVFLIVIWPAPRRVASNAASGLFRDTRSSFFAGWITVLLVEAAAPLAILVILVLELLSFVPFIGDDLKTLTQNISEAGLWESLKDICIFITDSSRAAEARWYVEEEIRKLGDVESIHILAHSLGTVVAYDTLVQLGRGDGALFNKETGNEYKSVVKKIRTLVTFGCPLNKIRLLADLTERDDERARETTLDCKRFDDTARLSHDLGGGDFKWVNVYALQDVASDICSTFSPEKEPDSSRVPIRPLEFSAWTARDILTAHGDYWIDPGFWNTALEAMNIVYPRGQMRRIEKLRRDELMGKDPEWLREQGIVTQTQLLSQLEEQRTKIRLEKKWGKKVDTTSLREALVKQLAA